MAKLKPGPITDGEPVKLTETDEMDLIILLLMLSFSMALSLILSGT